MLYLENQMYCREICEFANSRKYILPETSSCIILIQKFSDQWNAEAEGWSKTDDFSWNILYFIMKNKQKDEMCAFVDGKDNSCEINQVCDWSQLSLPLRLAKSSTLKECVTSFTQSARRVVVNILLANLLAYQMETV